METKPRKKYKRRKHAAPVQASLADVGEAVRMQIEVDEAPQHPVNAAIAAAEHPAIQASGGTVATPSKGGLRPPLRPDLREKDPREAARLRTAELLGNLPDDDAGQDEFYVDSDVIPDGWTYEWKTKTVYNMENPAYTVALAQTGWEAVPASRHPEMMPLGSTIAHILRKGQILMERPQEITDHYKEIDRRRAKAQVRVKEEQLSAAPAGQFERDKHPQARPKISKTFEPMPIPKD